MQRIHSKTLLNALTIWYDDPFVHLPKNEIERLVSSIKGK